MSSYFEFTIDTIDYSDDDFDFVTGLFEFDSDEVEPSPESLFFTFDDDVAPPPPPPPTTIETGGIVLSFRDPKALNPYNARSIDGLDGGVIRPKYYSSADGQKFYTLEQEPREIVVKAGLNPDFSDSETYSGLRDNLYKMVTMSKSGRVDIHFKNVNELVAILTGFVTKIESNPSDKDQMMAVTINCEDPVLRSPTPVVIGVDLLEFDDLMVQDDISTSPHGISFRIRINEAIPDLIITDPTDDSWYFRVIPIDGFTEGEILYFSSEVGRKECRTGSRDLMSLVTGNSIWPIVFPGENHFSFNHPDSLSWQQLSHYRAYWGV